MRVHVLSQLYNCLNPSIQCSVQGSRSWIHECSRTMRARTAGKRLQERCRVRELSCILPLRVHHSSCRHIEYRPLWRGQEDAALPLAEARIHCESPLTDPLTAWLGPSFTDTPPVALEAQLRVEKAAREVQSRLISAIEPVLTVGDPVPV